MRKEVLKRNRKKVLKRKKVLEKVCIRKKNYLSEIEKICLRKKKKVLDRECIRKRGENVRERERYKEII